MAEISKNKKDMNTPSWQTAKVLFSERKYVLAQGIVDQLIATSGIPSESGNLFMSARIYRMNGEYDKALTCWDHFFSVNPENYSKIKALNEMSVCYYKSHQYEEAVRVYDQILEMSPRDKPALFGKSLALMKQDLNEESMKLLSEALALFPDDTRVINQYAKALQYLGQYKEAGELYRKALEIETENFFSWSGLFICLKEQAEQKEAANVLEKLNSLAGKDIRALDKFVRELYIDGDSQLAAEFISTISDSNINDQGYLRLAGEIFIEQGNQTHKEDYYYKALERLTRLESLPQLPNATTFALIGTCHLHLGNTDKAENYFKKVLQYFRDPLSAGAKRLIHKTGEQLLRVDKADLAVDFFLRLLSHDKDNQYGLDGLGRAYRELGKYDESIEVYEKKLSLYPNDVYALDGLALVYKEKGDLEKAIEVFNRLAVVHGEERDKLEKRISSIRSERIRAETEQFNQRKLSALSTMTSGISHELSQPLAIISWNVSSVIRDINKNRLNVPQLKDTLEKMGYQTRRINDILQTFKELSREHPLIIKEVDLHTIVRRTFEMFANQLKIRNIRVNLSRLHHLGPKVLADELRMEQVLMNLILNSRDALQGRSDGFIECRTYSYGHLDRRRVFLVFRDNGPGIPEEIRARIYDPFFTTKPVGRGTGLGLSIIFQYIQDMGGNIELDETYRTGAGFKITLKSPVRR